MPRPAPSPTPGPWEARAFQRRWKPEDASPRRASTGRSFVTVSYPSSPAGLLRTLRPLRSPQRHRLRVRHITRDARRAHVSARVKFQVGELVIPQDHRPDEDKEGRVLLVVDLIAK